MQCERERLNWRDRRSRKVRWRELKKSRKVDYGETDEEGRKERRKEAWREGRKACSRESKERKRGTWKGKQRRQQKVWKKEMRNGIYLHTRTPERSMRHFVNYCFGSLEKDYLTFVSLLCSLLFGTVFCVHVCICFFVFYHGTYASIYQSFC